MKRFAILLLYAGLCAVALTHAPSATAQTYPSKPIRLIVPFAAGGDIEPIARILGEHLQTAWGQPVLVEARPGAAGTIGSDFVAKSTPDGYTLLMCSAGPITISPALYATLPYSVDKDFEPVALIGGAPMVLLVNDTVAATNFAEFLALAKSKPGALTVASSGIGSMAHLTAMFFSGEAGVKLTHVPYRGSAPAVQDLLGGHVNLAFNPMPSALGAVTSGKLRTLAVSSAKRTPLMPNVPTLDELGVKGFEAVSWYGVCAPSGVPKDVVQKLNVEVNRATSLPAFQARLRTLGTDPSSNATIEDFRALLRKDAARWSRVIRENDIKPN
jgi:tripartite-type tricarboxylate transporter receptor subunit TctC